MVAHNTMNTSKKYLETEIDTRQAMKISVVEGIFAQVHATLTAIGSAFITKAAIVLQATPMQFSILNGIAQLSLFFQLYAVKHNEKVSSRKKPCVQFAMIGRMLSVFLGVCLAIANRELALYCFLIVLFISAVFQTISGNMWVAWISDLIPKRVRGRFFSRRMQINLIFSLAFGYLFTFLIDLFEATSDSWKHALLTKLNLTKVFVVDNLPVGLAVVFTIGATFGIYGLLLLKKQPERRIIRKEQGTASLLEPLQNKSFLKLLRFQLWWMFAIGVGAPFWGKFMLSALGMSLVELQLYSMLSAVGMFISFRFWGKFIDKFGNKTAMKLCVLLGAINPAMWIFLTPTNYFLIFFEAFTSGMMWSGANLITFNFVLAIAPKGKEQHWSAVYSGFGGIMMLTTILLSGLLYPKTLVVGNLCLQPEQVLFGLASIFRISAELPLHFVEEPKSTGLRKTIGYASDYVMAKLMRFRTRMFKIFVD